VLGSRLAVLEEMVTILVCAEQPVPLELLHRFKSVVLEDSSSIALPKELADCWAGSGGGSGGGEAAVKLHVRWNLTRGQISGPCLTDGRVSDQCSPFHEVSLPVGSLYIADLGYFDLDAAMERRKAGSYTLTRARSNTAFFDSRKVGACVCRPFCLHEWDKPKSCMCWLGSNSGIRCDC
jgi:hypothetical protein